MSHRCGEGVICCELNDPSNTKLKINLHGILSTWLSRVYIHVYLVETHY